MKKKTGRLGRLLGILIILGIIGAAGLCYMGYQKANDAEAATTSVAELRTTYIGEAQIKADSALWEDILTNLGGDNEMIQSITAALGDSTMAEMISENYYLPTDDTVSTAIGQKILTHRLSKTYSNEELLYIYSAMMDYAPINTVSSSAHPETDILADILEYLTGKNLIKEETAEEIKSYLE